MSSINENSDLLNAVTERVKELTCLYEVSKLLADPEKSLEDIFNETVKMIPPAWQYPDITCARIIFDDKEYRTQDFRQTEWILSSDVTIRNENRGKIEVVYTEEKPVFDEGPFLKEERHLIDTLAREMRAIIKRKLAEEGNSYSELVDRVRIRAAEQLLKKPGMTTKEIAYSLGYSGSNNFIRAFKRLTGHTPSEFRNTR